MPFTLQTILTDNGIQFAKRQGTEAHWDIPFDRICKAHHIEHRLTQVCHPWTNGLAERMNRTQGGNGQISIARPVENPFADLLDGLQLRPPTENAEGTHPL